MNEKTQGRAEMDGALAVRLVPGIKAFARGEWETLGATSRNNLTGDYNPFISYDFISSLEESGCATSDTGWQPHHLRLEDASGALIGAALCYAKSHSQGEYVFDHGWADAFERAGGVYYPKLQVAVPFTPATGPRLLVNGEQPEAKAALATALRRITDQSGVSSCHVTFADDDDMAALANGGFLERTDLQFHFRSSGYANYNDFLADLSSRKRKALRKERREALADGISIEWLTGRDITEEAWESFFAFYMDTGSRKWGRPYLNRKFFALIGERMADDILLIMARRAGRYIAGAINFIGSDRLFGRNWGCIEDHPFLHFEVCYHQAIDFALANGLSVVEAGAQGEHKLSRGYLPVKTRSAHYIAHPGLRRAVADYLVNERREIDRIEALYGEQGPFRRDEADVSAAQSLKKD